MRPTQLIYHVLSGYASAREKLALEKWKNESRQNEIEFERLKKLWEDTGFESLNEENGVEDLLRLRARMERWNKNKVKRKYFLYVVIAIVILLLICLSFYYFGENYFPSAFEE